MIMLKSSQIIFLGLKKSLNIQTASIIEDWPSVHNTSNVLKAKSALSLRVLG